MLSRTDPSTSEPNDLHLMAGHRPVRWVVAFFWVLVAGITVGLGSWGFGKFMPGNCSHPAACVPGTAMLDRTKVTFILTLATLVPAIAMAIVPPRIRWVPLLSMALFQGATAVMAGLTSVEARRQAHLATPSFDDIFNSLPGVMDALTSWSLVVTFGAMLSIYFEASVLLAEARDRRAAKAPDRAPLLGLGPQGGGISSVSELGLTSRVSGSTAAAAHFRAPGPHRNRG